MAGCRRAGEVGIRRAGNGTFRGVTLVEHLVLLIHLLGFAALFGGCIVQLRAQHPEVNAAMVYGAVTQLVTGIVLVVLLELVPPAEGVNHVKVTIKALVTLVITILIVANRRFATIPRGLLRLITGLTLATAALAVLW